MLGEVFEENHRASGVVHFDGWEAHDCLIAFKVVGGAGFGGDNDVVADGGVSDDASLSSDAAIGAQLNGSSDSNLRDEQTSFADSRAVTDDDGVADFRSGSNNGVVEGAAFDGGVGTDFDIVF